MKHIFSLLIFIKKRQILLHFQILVHQFASSSKSSSTCISTSNSNGTWTDKQLSKIITAKEISVKATFLFHVTATTNKFWNDGEIMLKSFLTSHLQMMKRIEPLFKNGMSKRNGTPKGVDETHHSMFGTSSSNSNVFYHPQSFHYID